MEPDGPDVPAGLERLDAGVEQGVDAGTRLVHRWMRDERAARRVLGRFRDARAAEAAPGFGWARVAQVGALAAVALVALLALRPAGRGVAPALAVRGEGARWSVASHAGQPGELTAGGTLEVASGEVSLALGELAIRARAGVRVTAVELGGSRTVTLRQEAGSAVYELAPHAGYRLAIATPAATVRVVGTRFRVVVDGAHTTVAVGRGRVQVEGADGAGRAVDASHQVVCAAGAPVPEPTAFNMIVDEDFAEGGPASLGISR